LLCKTSPIFAQSQTKPAAQDEGSEVGVLSMEGGKVTSTIKKSSSENHKGFTDKIKVLRVSEGDWDVYFENNGGPYSIPDKELEDEGTYQNVFQKAYEEKVQLQVTVDAEKEQILTVRKPAASSRQPAGTSGYEQLPDRYKYMEDIIKKQVQPPAN
jgi:hypothetical protein